MVLDEDELEIVNRLDGGFHNYQSNSLKDKAWLKKPKRRRKKIERNTQPLKH